MSRMPSLARRALAVVSAVAVAATLVTVLPGAASATPVDPHFSCDSGGFFRISSAKLSQASDPNGTWSEVIANTTVLNAIGYNSRDQYIYGMKNTNKVFKITKLGTFEVGAITDLPSVTYVAGDIDQGTGLYYVSSNNDNLYAIDLTAKTASAVSFSTSSFQVGNDIVIVDGWVWTVKGSKVYGLKLADGTTKSYNFDPDLMGGGSIGGAMWYEDGSNTMVMEITGVNKVINFSGLGGASINAVAGDFSATGSAPIDGASCRKVLSVNPDPQTVTYGDSAPTYTYSISGWLGSDNPGNAAGFVAPQCTSTYTSTTPVSASPVTITCSGGSATNYKVDMSATADLTINKATLTVTPDNKGVNYGDPAPSYTKSVTGFKNSQTAGTASGYSAPDCSSAYTSTTGVSSSPVSITCSGGAADNYDFTYNTASLTISKAALIVTPDAKSRTYGDGAPTYTFVVTGWNGSDDENTAAGYSAPQCTSAYTSTTDVSASPVTISCSGGSSDNYTFNTAATAGLTISKKTLTVTPDAKTRTYGQAAPSYTFGLTGFVNSQNSGSAAGYSAPICSSSYTSTTSTKASPLTISCSGGSADNYTFNTAATSLLTINYPTDSLDCATRTNYRLANGTLSGGTSFSSSWTTLIRYRNLSNGIALRPADNRIYGFDATPSSNVLYRAGTLGVTNLGSVTGLPQAKYMGADFDEVSGLMYVYAPARGANGLYAINLDTFTATKVTIGTTVTLGQDLAVVDGYIWSYNKGSIIRVRISDGQVTQKSSGLAKADIVGALWYDENSQTIYGEKTSNGALIKTVISNPAQPVTTNVGFTNSSASAIDGAFCKGNLPG